MTPGPALYPEIARVIAGEPQACSIAKVAGIMGKRTSQLSHLMNRMRDDGLLEVIVLRGRKGLNHGWRLTPGGHTLLNGYVPSDGDAGNARRLNAAALLAALGIPRIAPPPPRNAAITTVVQK